MYVTGSPIIFLPVLLRRTFLRRWDVSLSSPIPIDPLAIFPFPTQPHLRTRDLSFPVSPPGDPPSECLLFREWSVPFLGRSSKKPLFLLAERLSFFFLYSSDWQLLLLSLPQACDGEGPGLNRQSIPSRLFYFIGPPTPGGCMILRRTPRSISAPTKWRSS